MAKRAKNPNTPAFTGKYYLTNATLLPEVIKCIEKGKMSNELAKMLMLLTERYSKTSKFGGYTFREDMVSEALINLCKNALKFDPVKSSNPFSFYTTAIHNSFLQFLNNEKKHRNIRDKMLIQLGENPSFNYMANENKSNSDMSSDNIGTQEIDHVHEEIKGIHTEIGEAHERKVIQDEKDLEEKLLEEKLLLEAEDDIINDNDNSKEFFQYESS